MFYKLLNSFTNWGRRSRSGGSPQEGFDWSTNGEGAGEYAGYETPAKLKDTADQWGQNYGAARVPARTALNPDKGPEAWLGGASGARKGKIKENGFRAAVSAAKRAKTADARKLGAKEKVRVLAQRLMGLQVVLPEAEAQALRLRGIMEDYVEHFLTLPRSHRGFFESVLVVWFVGLGVVLFDCWVLHGALESSGMSPVTVWGTSVTVPLAIAAVNHSLGIAAGAAAGNTTSNVKRRLAFALFGACMTTALVSFVLLTIFRTQAADSQNAAIEALASGDADAQLTFFVSPIWMGPLQIAGSFAAIAVGALWSVAKQGRDFKSLVIKPARQHLEMAEGEVSEIKSEIKGTQQEIESWTVEEFNIEGDKQAAMIEVEAEKQATHAKLEGEEGLKAAVQGEFEAAYTYFDQIGQNGGVWRVARPTVFPRFGGPFTPGASDAEGGAATGSREHVYPQQNGHSDPSTNGSGSKSTHEFS